MREDILNIEAILNFSPAQLAEDLRQEGGGAKAPIDVIAVAAKLGCKVASPGQISSTRSVEADLRPYQAQDRFYVRVDPVPRQGWAETPELVRAVITRHRFRFRVCHELGHTFFFNRRAGTGPRRARPWSTSEEIWCDRFARNLLVPGKVAKQVPATADSPFILQAHFDVSLEVAARAFSSAHHKLELALWFWPPGAAVNPSSLLPQWTSALAPSLRPWREAKLIANAIDSGHAEGKLPKLGHRGGWLKASARCDHDRRQLIAVAQR